MNIKQQIESMYDYLFSLQAQERKLFHELCKDGKMNLDKKTKYDLVRQEVITKYDELKALLVAAGKEYVIHLQWGNIYNVSSYTINESRQFISCNETSRWVYRGLHDISN